MEVTVTGEAAVKLAYHVAEDTERRVWRLAAHEAKLQVLRMKAEGYPEEGIAVVEYLAGKFARAALPPATEKEQAVPEGAALPSPPERRET